MAKETGVRPLDDLAIGLESGAISRGKAIKLGGAALVASALGLFASAEGAQGQTVTTEGARRRCHRRGGDFCRTTEGSQNCHICCRHRHRRKACCGPSGCNCCRKGQRCLHSGQCGE